MQSLTLRSTALWVDVTTANETYRCISMPGALEIGNSTSGRELRAADVARFGLARPDGGVASCAPVKWSEAPMHRLILALTIWFAVGAADSPAIADDWPIGPPAPLMPVEMTLIKGSCYKMGDTFGEGAGDERPVHEVCVKDFYIGTYLVTQMQWTGTMGTNPSREPLCGMTCPVENVSWNEVQEFIRKLNQRTGKAYRLPTEAEWEYAARSGGRNEKWAGTSSENELADYAWYYSNSGFKTHPVGSKKPNRLGLYDMTGNVWEWMSDWYDEKYYSRSPKDEPRGAETGGAHSLRGGYWGDLPSFVRVTRRIGLAPSARGGGYGFRLALTAP
jgi:sulfatase modifying factor 1